MPKYQSPALDKGLDILEYLATSGFAQSQTEIALGVHRKPNEIYRMLVCMEERGYIEKDGISGKFDLSLKLYHLSRLHSPINSIRKAALYPMRELSEFSEHSCHLTMLYKNNVMVVTQVLSPGPVSLSVEDGCIVPIYNSTSGRMILSQLTDKEQKYYLNKNNGFKKLSKGQKEEYLSKIEEIARKGHEVCLSETTDGVLDIAIPFSVPEIDITGSIVVTILSGLTQKSISHDKIIEKMYLTVENIYKKIGFDSLNKKN